MSSRGAGWKVTSEKMEHEEKQGSNPLGRAHGAREGHRRWECECSLRWMHGVHDGPRGVAVCVRKAVTGHKAHAVHPSVVMLWTARAFLPQKVPWVPPTRQCRVCWVPPASPAPSPSEHLAALSRRSTRASHP